MSALAPVPVTGPGPESDAVDVYALGSDPAERARLQRQSEELRPESVALLSRIGLQAGQSAIDLGCGPSGILDLLSAAVSAGRAGGRAGRRHRPCALARRYAHDRGLANVEVMTADARHTGLPSDAFDLVHARTLLVTIPGPAEVVAEMVRLARPGGWVASQEPDAELRPVLSVEYPPGTGCTSSSVRASAGQAPACSSAAA